MRLGLARKMRALDFRSVENRLGQGTPDANYVDGWLELKWLRGWPKKGGPVVISHYTDHQRLWLQRRWRCGGKAFLLLQIKLEWLLICGCDAGPIGSVTREELYSLAVFKSDKWSDSLIHWLQMPHSGFEDVRKQAGICGSPLLKSFSYSGAEQAKPKSDRPLSLEFHLIDT